MHSDRIRVLRRHEDVLVPWKSQFDVRAAIGVSWTEPELIPLM